LGRPRLPGRAAWSAGWGPGGRVVPDRPAPARLGSGRARRAGGDFLHMRRTGGEAAWRACPFAPGTRMPPIRPLALAALAVALAGALAGCQRTPSPAEDAAQAAREATPAADAAAATSGIDLAGIDESVAPGD